MRDQHHLPPRILTTPYARFEAAALSPRPAILNGMRPLLALGLPLLSRVRRVFGTGFGTDHVAHSPTAGSSHFRLPDLHPIIKRLPSSPQAAAALVRTVQRMPRLPIGPWASLYIVHSPRWSCWWSQSGIGSWGGPSEFMKGTSECPKCHRYPTTHPSPPAVTGVVNPRSLGGDMWPTLAALRSHLSLCVSNGNSLHT
jgi:hypothetical protein